MTTALGAGSIVLDVVKEVFDPLKDAIEGGVGTMLGVGSILLDVAGEVGEAFGPLKAALGVISIIYENYKVRLLPFTSSSFPTNLSTRHDCRQEKDSRSLFTHGCAGDDFQNTHK